MYNKIILIGNLTKDPELRYTPQGTPVGTFRIAVNTRLKSDDTKEETLFIDIVTFGRQAETSGQYLSKGSSVLVEGRLQERRWESEGQKRSKVEVVAQTVRFLSRKSEGGGYSGDMDKGVMPEDKPDETTDLEPF